MQTLSKSKNLRAQMTNFKLTIIFGTLMNLIFKSFTEKPNEEVSICNY